MMRAHWIKAAALAGMAFALAVGVPADAAKASFIECGPASNGLGVGAASARPRALACPTALAVAEAYLRESARGADKRSTFKIAGAVWRCEVRDRSTHPFIECAMRGKSRERVRMYS